MAKADRIVTDNGDTITLVKWNDKSISVDVIDDNGLRSVQITLTKRDLDELSEAIHRHDE